MSTYRTRRAWRWTRGLARTAWAAVWPVAWWLRPWGVVLTQREGLDALAESYATLRDEYRLTGQALTAQRETTNGLARQLSGLHVRVTHWQAGEQVGDTGWIAPGTWWTGHPGGGDWMRVDWQPEAKAAAHPGPIRETQIRSTP